MQETMRWVGVWGNSMSVTDPRPEGYAKDITLRYPIHMPFDAAALRLTLDNVTGHEKAVITRATVLLNGAIIPVTCGGAREFAIPAGGTVVTDPVTLAVSAGDTPLVCLYFGDFTPMRASIAYSGPLSDGAMYFTGDQTDNFSPDIALGSAIGRSWFLSTVSVLTAAENRAVVCFGDSITAQAWPDYAQLRAKEGGFAHTAFVRRASSGSRLLRAYTCVAYESYGRSGLDRFAHEIDVDGADTVIIMQGINDIIHPVGVDVNPFRPMSDLPTADELTDTLKSLIAQARERNLRVYVGTLLPVTGWRTYAPFREELRQAVNAFIRTTDLIDGCIDFDAAIREEGSPTGCRAGMLSADNLHPSDAGHRALADAVPQALMR